MRAVREGLAVLCVVLVTAHSQGQVLHRSAVDGSGLYGQLLDFTSNHGADRRIWSTALQQKRDLYVYLPPGYNPKNQYPLVMHLHGYAQDEEFFYTTLVGRLDEAIISGRMPPMIVAAPDGSLSGRPGRRSPTSGFINSLAGNYEDYLMVDVWNFMFANFPIRPERQAHALVGESSGGGAAFTQAIKHRDRFGVVVGIMPSVNLRWVDCRGRYKGKFSPCCAGWRNCVNPHETIARFYCIIAIHYGDLTDALFGRGPDAIARIAAVNPAELLEQYDVRPGDLDMYIGYAGRDQFNIDAQVESFLYLAGQRGIQVSTQFDPRGRHDLQTGLRLSTGAEQWLAQRLAPYGPPLVVNVAP